MNPELDLEISRVIRAPRIRVWRAWADPKRLEQWWVPAPAQCRVEKLELSPGGSFRTSIREGAAEFQPHLNACVLAVDEERRIVFTDALLAGWRPSDSPFMTAVITMRDHPDGTEYVACAMHRDRTARDTHERLGFFDGWATVTAQLAELTEQEEW
ncbi:activator of HSP90 ATPase [Rhizocola hellebori]|uniref:Activator of HSP90 ATPase n=1 Tax=Rhizocola hellebori TaxID=1392758 RepID=A0A8J3QEM1_9ACTN|nr:SRPBCC family protein [Rhizocola hellebori]GIH09435.1 activator of HSP90 ATPase [Rhizocola hellebori]